MFHPESDLWQMKLGLAKKRKKKEKKKKVSVCMTIHWENGDYLREILLRTAEFVELVSVGEEETVAVGVVVSRERSTAEETEVVGETALEGVVELAVTVGLTVEKRSVLDDDSEEKETDVMDCEEISLDWAAVKACSVLDSGEGEDDSDEEDDAEAEASDEAIKLE